MIDILSVENMRKSDAARIAGGVPGRELMGRAAEGVFREAGPWAGPVAVACGSGNNAGDGYALALLLKGAGIQVKLVLAKESFSEDGAFYFGQCRAEGIDFALFSGASDFKGCATVVDCLLGTGYNGSMPRSPYKEMIAAINDAGASGTRVVSVDINSGLNGSNGLGECFVRSELTVSIGSFKPGHFLNMAKDAMKAKFNCDIGIPPAEKPFRLLEEADLAQVLKPRPNFANKADYGYIALMGGSLPYSGAIRLATLANCGTRCGAGVISVAVPKSIAPLIAEKILDCTCCPLSEKDGYIQFNEAEISGLCRRYRLIALGMGMGNTEDTEKIAEYLLENYSGTLLVDADGLSALAKLPRELIKSAKARLVLTPHPKEFSRLSGLSTEEVLAAPVDSAIALAKELGAIVLLKGPTTVVTDGQDVLFADRGCPGMATAGSGDVLSGILAALLAFNQDELLLATAAGAYINGMAGELAQYGSSDVCMTAGDTAAATFKIMVDLTKAHNNPELAAHSL